MDPIIIATLTISTFATLCGIFAKTTRRMILVLSFQATVLGLVELISCLINLIRGLGLEALIDFFATFAEWFSAAAVSPLIIYWGMAKTENVSDKSVLNIRRGGAVAIIIVVSNIILCIITTSFFPAKIDTLPFVALMLSISIFIIVTRVDALKILVGLNMAENSLYPLFAESPLSLIPLILVLMIFVNLVGVFIIREAYCDYGTVSVRKWRWMS